MMHSNKRFISLPAERLLRSLLFVICYLIFSPAEAQVGTWRAYMSYYEPQQIVKAGNQLFVRASNGLYSYNLNDHSITTYDKVNALSDTYITHIAWNPAAARLIIVYNNSNIDLLDSNNGTVTNISAIYSKAMTQDKTINNIYINDVYAYLATGFGVVKVNMKRGEIAESYIINENVSDVALDQSNIYVRTAEGNVFTGLLTSNLIDAHNWSAGTAPDGIFSTNLEDWNDNIELVRTLQPGGPKYNNFGFMRFKHNRLYTTGGGYSPDLEMLRPGSIQILKEHEWIIPQDNLSQVTGWEYIDVDAVDADPTDPDHIFAGARSGLYEFQDGNLVKSYNLDNSPLQSAVNPPAASYVMIESLCYGQNGSLWCFNSSTYGLENILELTSNGEWISHQKKQLTFTDSKGRNKSLKGMQQANFDSRGYIWFVNNNWEYPSFYCYDPQTDQILNSFKTIINQDGTSYTNYTPYCAVEDLEGNIWIGTNEGPFMLEADRILTEDTYVTQVKVPRNDGTNYADYLLAGAVTNCIVIDGGNRKWFGTKGSGIYLISADNMETLQHFTTSNSPLPSNNIESMAINNATGELFIGTDAGLCSYMTDATQASVEMVKDDVYAYPNPVVSGYDGLITIVGLSFNADVKILTANGQLVAEGRSNGGTFTWDGRDRSGKRVASGVYMVAAATSDGKKGTVCKIAIIK